MVLSGAITYFNVKRSFYFDAHLDKIKMYCHRFLLTTSYVCIIRVVFEIQLAELLIFIPLIAYSTIKIFDYIDGKQRGKMYNLMQQLENLPTSQIQQILLQMLQMTERQNSEDLKQLKTIFNEHRMSCFNLECICSKYESYVINKFKVTQQKKETSKEEVPLYDYDDTRKIMFDDDKSFMEKSGVRGLSNELEDQCNELRQSNANELSHMSIDSPLKLSGSQEKIQSPKGQFVEVSFMQKVDNFTFAFETNQVIQGLQIEDFYKEVSNIEHLNKKIYDMNNSQQQSARDKNDEQFLAFESPYEARKLLFCVSERLMLEEAMNNFKNYFGGFDYSLFIDGNQQQIELDANYEKTTLNIIDFWQKFKSDDIRIQQILDLGVTISQDINRIKRVTKRQEETYAIRKDLAKYQLYAMFHLEMLHDPFTFGQMAMYLKNSIVFKTRKFLGQDSGSGADSMIQYQQMQMDEKGICIAQAWAGERQSLQFLFGNKTFCEMFKTTQLLLPGNRIDNILPSEIQQQHQEFVKRFYCDAKPSILGNLRIQFARTFDGYLLPVKLRINFYFHPTFHYCFFAQFERIKFMNLFQEDQTKIATEDCMIITTDDRLVINEFSENVGLFSGVSREKLFQLEETLGRKVRLDDLIPELYTLLIKEFGENILPDSFDLSLVNKMIKFRKYSTTNGNNEEIQSFPCLLSYVQQLIQTNQGQKRMNIFLILPLSRHPDYEGILSSNAQGSKLLIHSQHADRQARRPSYTVKNGNSEHIIFNESAGSEEMKSFSKFLDISSQSTTSSTTSSGIMQAHYAKNLLFQNTAPKVIKINLILVITMIVAFFVINIYNLAVFLNKHSFIKGRFDTYSYISQRNSKLRASLLDLKMIHSIVQDVKNLNQSTILVEGDSRLGFYMRDLKSNIELVRQYSDQFNQFIMNNQEYYSFDMQFEDISFLTEKGFLYTENVSYKHSINLFMSYADQINLDDFVKQKPMLNVTNYAKNYSIVSNSSNGKILNRSLTQLEQGLFFLFENGIYKMSQLGQRQIFMLTEASAQQTDEGILMLNISTYVSITIVTLIGIIIFPLVTKIIERQYSVIRFFNYLDIDTIEKLISQGSDFQKTLQVKIGRVTTENNQSHATQMNLKDSVEKANNKISQQNAEDASKAAKDQINGQNTIDSPNRFTPKSEGRQKKQVTYKKGKNPHNSHNDNKYKGPNFVANDSKKSSRRNNQRQNIFTEDKEDLKYPKEEKKANENHKHSDEEDENHANEDEENHDPNLKRQKNQKASHHNFLEGDLGKLDISKNKQIAAQITKLSFQKRFKICFLLSILIVYLNSSLVISFYQSQLVFSNDKDSAQRINKFYQREECAYNLLLFMREKIIRNYSLPIEIYQNSKDFVILPAVSYLIDECFKNEYEISQMRKNLPDYLKNSAAQIEGLEGDKLCEMTYEMSGSDAVNQCEQAMDKILQKGISNSMFYIIGYIQQMNFNHDSPLSRSQEFLNSLLNQKKIHDLADFTLHFMSKGFNFLQKLVVTSGQDYFDEARSNFMLSFGLFMAVTAVLTLIIGIFVFRKTKQAILDIQNMLVLLPLDELTPPQRVKIENYLNK